MSGVGKHLIVEFYGCQSHGDPDAVLGAMLAGCVEAGATVIFSHIHPFSGGGVTGVVGLSESHMSIHTWPEHGYAAIDVFMCGEMQPEKAIPRLKEQFQPGMVNIKMIVRGDRIGEEE